MKKLCNKISAEKAVMEEWRVDMNRLMCGLLVFLTESEKSMLQRKKLVHFYAGGERRAAL